MVKMYKGYNVKIILAADTGACLAMLPVTIYDSSGNRVFQRDASGPWLYVRLPEGQSSRHPIMEKSKRETLWQGRGWILLCLTGTAESRETDLSPSRNKKEALTSLQVQENQRITRGCILVHRTSDPAD